MPTFTAMPIERVQARIAQIEQRLAAIEQLGGQPSARAAAPASGSASRFDASYSAAMDSTWGLTNRVGALDTTGSVSAPPELAVFGNGRIPRAALSPIGVGSHVLYGPAASAFQAMARDAAAQGVTIGVTDSYRSYDEQVDLAARKGLYRDGGLAAVPGTSSHGWGLALDVDVDERGLAWMRANAARYGFVETTPREPWHWEYRAVA